MSATVNRAEIERFVNLICAHVVKIGAPGLMQLDIIDPRTGKRYTRLFSPTDPEEIVAEAMRQANACMNVYMAGRTVKPGAGRNERCKKEATEIVFSLVVDSDGYKNGKATALAIEPSLTVQTSSRSRHHWILLNPPVPLGRAELLGEALRASCGDTCTGVITQGYRVAGTPNYPNKKKLAADPDRVVEPTLLIRSDGKIWNPDDLPHANSKNRSSGTGGNGGDRAIDIDDPRLDGFRDLIVVGSGPGMIFTAAGAPDRSETFATVVVRSLWEYFGASADQVYDLLASYPAGIANKYYVRGDLRERVDDEHAKTVANWRAYAQAKAQAKSARSAPPPPPPPQPPPPQPPSGAASAAPPPTALERAVAVYRKWLALKNDWPIYVTLGTIAANLLDGEPVWQGIIGPSSSAKTALLNSVSGLKDAAGKRFMHEVETFSPAGLLSGSSRKTRRPSSTGGVLVKLGQFGILVFMDFGSVLSLRQDPQAEMMSALRRVYDGFYSRDPGTDGGLHLEWTGKAGCLFGATQKYDGHHGMIGALGDRFLLLRIDAMLDEQLDMCRLQLGAGVSMRQELAQAAGRLFASLSNPPPAPERMSDQEYETLKKTIRLAVRLRAGVVRDGYRRDIDDVHDPEGPGRFALALQQLFAGLVFIGVERKEACAIVERVALDSAPRHRLVALRALTDSLQSTTEIAERTGLPKTPARRALEDLAAQGMARLEMANRLLPRGFGNAPQAVECWKRTKLAMSLM
jgi:hypothetical protein